MGLTLGPVNQVTSEGLPVLFIKDLPPVSSISIKVTRPQIYYGEIGYDYAVVGTVKRSSTIRRATKMSMPRTPGAVACRSTTLLRRMVLATNFQTSKILFSADITAAFADSVLPQHPGAGAEGPALREL